MINSAEEFIALADSDNPETRSRSLTESASIQVWERVISSYGDYETHILRNITIPMRIIETLANSKHWKTRHAVARKRKSGSQILTILSHDEEPLVRQAVAANKKTPLEILSALANDPDDRVRRVAAYNLAVRKN